MLRIDRLIAEELGRHLALEFRRTFGSRHEPLAELLEGTARLAIECLAQSGALYHNLEHTLLVSLVGQDILRGRLLRESLLPGDWLHFMIACLMHDIGYVGGLLDEDIGRACVSDGQGRMVTLPRGASDAALSPYHVDRSKLFVMRRFSDLEQIDAEDRREGHLAQAQQRGGGARPVGNGPIAQAIDCGIVSLTLIA